MITTQQFLLSKTVSHAYNHLHKEVSISYDQVYGDCALIGKSYKKYTEPFNHCYEQHYKKEFGNIFFAYKTIVLKLTS